MHPFVKILIFAFVLLLMSVLSNLLILALCITVCATSAILQFKRFYTVVKRMRLFFFSIFIIYAFGTPGEYIGSQLISVAPTYEGLGLGFMQIEKLLISLAALNMLFATNSKEHLMLGLNVLFFPLSYLGFRVERFAVRLLLTFEYIEVIASLKKRKFVFQLLDDIQSETDHLEVNEVIVMQNVRYGTMDKYIMTGLMLATIVLIAFKAYS